MQTKKSSLVETILNVLIGFFITLIVSPFIYAMCGIKANFNEMTFATLLFTVVSIIRSYIIRRWFNSKAKPSKSKGWRVYQVMGKPVKSVSTSIRPFHYATPSVFVLEEYLFALRNKKVIAFDTLEPEIEETPMYTLYMEPTIGQEVAQKPIQIQ